MGDSIDDPAEPTLNILLEGGVLVDLTVGAAIASGSPRGLDSLLDSLMLSTSEGDCPLRKKHLDSYISIERKKRLLCRGYGNGLVVIKVVFRGLGFITHQKSTCIVTHHRLGHG